MHIKHICDPRGIVWRMLAILVIVGFAILSFKNFCASYIAANSPSLVVRPSLLHELYVSNSCSTQSVRTIVNLKGKATTATYTR